MAKNDIIEKFSKYAKKGKLDEFYNYLKSNNLENRFIQDSCYYRPHNDDNYTQKKENDLSNFTLKILKDNLSKKYGKDLTDKFCEFIYNRKNHSFKRSDMFQLNAILQKTTYNDISNVTKIFDIACNENNIIGTHITGNEIGETLLNDGILLTGHKFAASNNFSNVKSSLELNINLFNNDPFGVLFNLYSGRNYNNYSNNNFNDIMLVSIPKDEIEQNKNGIIIQKNLYSYLNTKYIKGYTKINTKDGNIEDIVNNPIFSSKTEQQTDIPKNSDWKQELEDWYKENNTTKLQKFTSKISNFISKFSHKNDIKMLNASNDTSIDPSYNNSTHELVNDLKKDVYASDYIPSEYTNHSYDPKINSKNMEQVEHNNFTR